MSENITHTAVCDDCLRLMSHNPDICDAFKQAAAKHLDIARLGSVTRSTDRFNPDLLKQLRDGWDNRQPKDNFEPKLAYSLGALCHRAADRTMKPVFVQAAPEDTQSPKDVSIYHDVFLFREVYKEGVEKPYSPVMFGMKTHFEEHFRLLFQRALLELHTFIPDLTDAEAWLEKLFAFRQKFYVDIARYAEAYYHPNPEETRRYITEVNFYDENDDLIQLARAIQVGDTIVEDAVRKAFETGRNESKYAQALLLGLRYLTATNRFFTSAMKLDELKSTLDIGKPDVGR
jgi:hypothetical protein